MDATIILGGGLAGVSLAFFLNRRTVILEKEAQPGGLCRSYLLNNVPYDIGPHALFSKNKEILSHITALTETATLRRSNKICHDGRFVKYPFENDLSSLPPAQRDYCLKEFLNNPYAQYGAENMLQFFLKTFGEGITRLYLQPYNEKIWKFDPAFMDTQMVERIPKPPPEDVVKSARGIPTEGYLHQLYFQYPARGGIQQLINSLAEKTAHKTKIINPVAIEKIFREQGRWQVKTAQGTLSAETLINCMPLHELLRYLDVPPRVRNALNSLKYNSIHIAVLQCAKDALGDNFAVYVPDKDVIFHRISKINFLGERYCLENGGSTILAEITFRPGSYLADIPPGDILKIVVRDFERLGLVTAGDILDSAIRSFTYAYVIYDLEHRKNTDIILRYMADIGIHCCGRFAEFEYLNMDGIFEHSFALAQTLNGAADA